VADMSVAVVGAGVVGLAATAALLEHGVRAVCFERLAPMAERSAGESRIFRLAHRDPELVDLAQQSRRLFADWEAKADEELIDPVGVVVSGEGTHVWSAAMSAAGAVHQEVGPDSELLRLPTRKIHSESVIDPYGGVLRVARIGAFLTSRCHSAIRLEHVYAVEDGPDGVVVRTNSSQDRYDAVILCAGAWTAPLAVQAGLHPPSALAHHARFTYRVRPHGPTRPQCWISTSGEGLGTYQHTNAPGQWAVGAHIDPTLTAWEVGAEKATQTARDITTSYVRATLDTVDPEPIAQLYCTVIPDLGDGVQFLRNGRVLAVYGENLFKFAPLIGNRLAEATIDGSAPVPMGSHR
jgi:sarcosine oxidase